MSQASVNQTAEMALRARQTGKRQDDFNAQLAQLQGLIDLAGNLQVTDPRDYMPLLSLRADLTLILEGKEPRRVQDLITLRGNNNAAAAPE